MDFVRLSEWLVTHGMVNFCQSFGTVLGEVEFKQWKDVRKYDSITTTVQLWNKSSVSDKGPLLLVL